ncbi:hypothetical protein X975_02781, partial [Stegodyphus mimosarum]
MENGRSSIFYASLESHHENYPTAVFYASVESGEDSDSFKSVKSNNADTSSSDSETPPSVCLVNNLENFTNNNGIYKSPTLASSPVPVPNSRQRMDSMSSLGSWQYVSGTGSLLGSVTSRSSSAELNMNGLQSNHSLSQENGNVASSSASVQERTEKLLSIHSLINSVYRKVIESKDSSYSERSSYFPWRR